MACETTLIKISLPATDKNLAFQFEIFFQIFSITELKAGLLDLPKCTLEARAS